MAILTETVTLRNGLKMPKVAFGTWQSKPGYETYNAITNALKTGYRFLDTAWSYRNEESVGDAVLDSGIKREDIFIQTKLPGEVKTDRDEILRRFEHSLKNLSTDYVDSYIIHAPWPWTNPGQNCDPENRQAWHVLEEIYNSGRAKSIGISNFAPHDIENIINDPKTTVLPMVNQIQYYVGYTQNPTTKASKDNGIIVQAYSPLATGRLLENDTILSLAKKYSVTTAQLALRYCIENDIVPIPKARSIKHIQNDAELDFKIEAEDLKKLDQLSDPSAGRGWHAETHEWFDI
ncbi:aldo/keto reductase family protein [Oenococcus alcoholitolerans]|uniref:aldo/keto reductase family protein n=1 Tax=Oenococcus alcoholitolerans TaxID=931074 RepID=UPI003F6E4E1F